MPSRSMGSIDKDVSSEQVYGDGVERDEARACRRTLCARESRKNIEASSSGDREKTAALHISDDRRRFVESASTPSSKTV